MAPSDDQRILLGLDTFGYLPMYACGRMDIFRFLDRAHALKLDGAKLNIGIARENWGALGGIEDAHLQAVRRKAESLGLFVEVDSRGTDYDHLVTTLRICRALGADILRTYASIDYEVQGPVLAAYLQPGGGLERDLASAVTNLRRVLPLCEEYGVRIALENHEYETTTQMIGLVNALNSPWVGLLVDTGNMMQVWEDPLTAVAAMAPYAISTHFKDQAVIVEDGEPVVVGTPVGQGNIDCAGCFRLLTEHSTLRRIMIQVEYGYRSHFRAMADQSRALLGTGAFRIVEPPYDPRRISPYPNYIGPDQLTPAAWEQLLAWHEQAIIESVHYVRALNRHDTA